MRRRARPEVLLLLSSFLGCSEAHAPERAVASGWYAFPDARFVAVRVARDEMLFLGKYDVGVRHEVEYVTGLCMDRPDAPSPQLRTRVEVEPSGAVTMIEETNRPGECSRTPKQAVTRTKLEPITDPARIADLDAKVRPFFDAESCKRYDACCADHTRQDWDAHCEKRRTIPAGCWSHWLVMNEDRACP